MPGMSLTRENRKGFIFRTKLLEHKYAHLTSCGVSAALHAEADLSLLGLESDGPVILAHAGIATFVDGGSTRICVYVDAQDRIFKGSVSIDTGAVGVERVLFEAKFCLHR